MIDSDWRIGYRLGLRIGYERGKQDARKEFSEAIRNPELRTAIPSAFDYLITRPKDPKRFDSIRERIAESIGDLR